jgi:hypothetical protein
MLGGGRETGSDDRTTASRAHPKNREAIRKALNQTRLNPPNGQDRAMTLQWREMAEIPQVEEGIAVSSTGNLSKGDCLECLPLRPERQGEVCLQEGTMEMGTG